MTSDTNSKAPVHQRQTQKFISRDMEAIGWILLGLATAYYNRLDIAVVEYGHG